MLLYLTLGLPPPFRSGFNDSKGTSGKNYGISSKLLTNCQADIDYSFIPFENRNTWRTANECYPQRVKNTEHDHMRILNILLLSD